MKILHWNISWSASKEQIADSLLPDMTGDYLICLQEVTPSVYEYFIERFKPKGCSFTYSLSMRQPGYFDGKTRKLGVLVMASSSIEPLHGEVIRRAPYPDRTALLQFKFNGHIYSVLSLHSVAGCNFKKAKSVQFNSFAEAIKDFQPDIVTIDANEPKSDHFEVSKMEFFDNQDKGQGAGNFFKAMNDAGLTDAYAWVFDKDSYEPGKPLATSYIRGKEHMRYDFIFIRTSVFDIESCEYRYEESVQASSDHSKIVLSGNLKEQTRCIAEQHNADYCRKELLSKCRYYTGNEDRRFSSSSDQAFSEYENAWIRMMLEDKETIATMISEYVCYGLDTFNMDDGVPETLKALLWNRYCHWELTDADGFREWYLKCYLKLE